MDLGDSALAGLDSMPGSFQLAAAADGAAAPAPEPAAGPVPLLPDWSKLLSLSASDWAAALQDLHGQPPPQPHQPPTLPAAEPRERPSQAQRQDSGTAAAVGEVEVSSGADLQQEISLVLRPPRQQQPPPAPPSGLLRQVPLPAGHKRTFSKISPISSGLEDTRLGRGSTP